jgi:hypothetical protein
VGKKPIYLSGTEKAPVYERIRQILESARSSVARTVNTTQVIANWLIGREIVEEVQKGRRRAEYAQQLLPELSVRLTADYGRGYSVDNLEFFRLFFLEYKSLLGSEKSDALRRISTTTDISDAVRRKSMESNTVLFPQGQPAPCSESWKPGQLHPNLSWTHYRTLLRVEKTGARSFYEIEAIRNNWSARELERQINSLLYERLALSKDKKGVMRLALKGQTIQRPADVFKDPVGMLSGGCCHRRIDASTHIRLDALMDS